MLLIKFVRVVLTTLALIYCVQTYVICVSVRERLRAGEREYAMFFPYIIKCNFVAKTWTRSVDFILLFNVFICLASAKETFLIIINVENSCYIFLWKL